MSYEVTIEFVDDTEAPVYSEEAIEVDLERAVIIEPTGSESGHEVDFQCKGKDGKFYVVSMPGSVVCAIAAGIRGCEDSKQKAKVKNGKSGS